MPYFISSGFCTGGNSIDVSGLRSDLWAVRDEIRNKKEFAFSADENGFTKRLIGKQSVTTYYANLHQQ